MIINKHNILNPMANIYQISYCEHCGHIFETWLGGSSFDGLKCIDRDIVKFEDIPQIIRSYANFNGLVYDHSKNIFIKPYANKKFSIDRLSKIVDKLMK